MHGRIRTVCLKENVLPYFKKKIRKFVKSIVRRRKFVTNVFFAVMTRY